MLCNQGQQAQKYTNAWYGADHKAMESLISDDFVGIYRNQNGAEIERIPSEQLVRSTKDEAGQRENKIYYNRILSDIHICN